MTPCCPLTFRDVSESGLDYSNSWKTSILNCESQIDSPFFWNANCWFVMTCNWLKSHFYWFGHSFFLMLYQNFLQPQTQILGFVVWWATTSLLSVAHIHYCVSVDQIPEFEWKYTCTKIVQLSDNLCWPDDSDTLPRHILSPENTDSWTATDEATSSFTLNLNEWAAAAPHTPQSTLHIQPSVSRPGLKWPRLKDWVHITSKRFFLVGCVIPPLAGEASSRNLGKTFLRDSLRGYVGCWR